MNKLIGRRTFTVYLLLNCYVIKSHCTQYEMKVHEDLLKNYNPQIRPVKKVEDRITLEMKLYLQNILDLNLRDQILAARFRLYYSWTDAYLKWNPENYGNISKIFLPNRYVWLPDVSLFNCADGRHFPNDVSTVSITYTGKVEWSPTTTYKSICETTIETYPFDTQVCFFKFGSWTYDGHQVNVTLNGLMNNERNFQDDSSNMAFDLSEYRRSFEWNILSIAEKRNLEYFPCCEAPYLDISFNITLRRNPRFYMAYVILPLVGISYLSVLVFFLPVDSGEKITLCISVLISQIMYILLTIEIMPTSSQSVPLIGKLLILHMILVICSVICTTIVLNVYYRKANSQHMKPWIKVVFLGILPKILFVNSPSKYYVLNRQKRVAMKKSSVDKQLSYLYDITRTEIKQSVKHKQNSRTTLVKSSSEADIYEAANTKPSCRGTTKRIYLSPCIKKAVQNINFMQKYLQDLNELTEGTDEWKMFATVLDRIFLILFNFAYFVGTAVVMMNATALFDNRTDIDGNSVKLFRSFLNSSSSGDFIY